MAWNGFSPLHAVFDERRSDMNSAFEDMNMEENPFEDGGLPAGDSGKEENGHCKAAYGKRPFAGTACAGTGRH